MTSTEPRAIWIVDGAYLMKAAPGHFDYLKLKDLLEKIIGASFSDSYFLNSAPNSPSDGQDSFHSWLKRAPPLGPKMRVKLYDLKETVIECRNCGNQTRKLLQVGVDVGIATLIVKLAAQNRYQRLVLSTGDGDFEDAIAFAKEELHKEIILCGFHDSISPDLQSYADSVIWLNDHWEKIQRG